jgi:hypothetical protein
VEDTLGDIVLVWLVAKLGSRMIIASQVPCNQNDQTPEPEQYVIM